MIWTDERTISNEYHMSCTETSNALKHNCTQDEVRRTECNKNISNEARSEILRSRQLLQDRPRTIFASPEFSGDGRPRQGEEGDTLVFPLIQMGSFGVKVDQEVTGQLLRSAEADSVCALASGYFNLTKEYMDMVLGSRARYNILMASPKVRRDWPFVPVYMVLLHIKPELF